MNELVQSWLTPPAGGWRCRCGNVIDFPGLCEVCGKALERRIAKDQVMERIATIPQRFRWATFLDPALVSRCGQNAVGSTERAADRLRDRRQNVVLVGPAGSGKTSLACAALRWVLESPVGFSGRFCSVVEVARSRMDSGLGQTPTAIADAIRASVIVFDDVGQEPSKASDVVTEIVHARHNSEAPTIYTTFLAPVELADRYGDGTARRMLEHAVIVQVGGENA